MTESPRRPVVGVSTLIRRDGQVLLVRRANPPLADVWAFPGGRVEFGERLAEAAAREVREETALTVTITGAIDHADIILRDDAGAPERHFVLIVFAGEWVAGEPLAGDDAADALWVPESDLHRFAKTPDTERILARVLAERPVDGRAPQPAPGAPTR